MPETNADEPLRIPGTIARHEPVEADWQRLAESLAQHYAGGLFTILQVDKASGHVRRVYSTNPQSYAPSGTKNLMHTPWARQVIEEGRCFIAATREEMEAAFADYRTLHELGCTTALNIPLRQGSEIAWTVNLLRGGAVYSHAESIIVKSSINQWIGELFSQSSSSRSA